MSLARRSLYPSANKGKKGKTDCLVVMIKGSNSEVVSKHLTILPRSLRMKVKEITIDLSPSMKIIAKRAFTKADIVSDRFHVQNS
ncbi:MAG: transposase [Bacteroidales bacterium]